MSSKGFFNTSSSEFKHSSWIEKDHDHHRRHRLELNNDADKDHRKGVGLIRRHVANNTKPTLPPSEILPRHVALGGYIFVCNNETMQDDLRRQLFGIMFH